MPSKGSGRARRIAERIARFLSEETPANQYNGLHGAFTFGRYDYDTVLHKETGKYIKVKSERPRHFYRAIFDEYQDTEQLVVIGEAFLSGLYNDGYEVKTTITYVKVEITNQKGEAEDDWRSLTHTVELEAAFSQIDFETTQWMEKSEYQAIVGFEVVIKV